MTPVSLGVMTPPKIGTMPNTPGTPRRTFRVEDELWEDATAIAKIKGHSLSADVLRPALEAYVTENRADLRMRPDMTPAERQAVRDRRVAAQKERDRRAQQHADANPLSPEDRASLPHIELCHYAPI